MSNQTKEPVGAELMVVQGIIADGLVLKAQESLVTSLCHCANAFAATRGAGEYLGWPITADQKKRILLLESCIVDYVAELLRLTLDIPAEEKEEDNE